MNLLPSHTLPVSGVARFRVPGIWSLCTPTESILNLFRGQLVTVTTVKLLHRVHTMFSNHFLYTPLIMG